MPSGISGISMVIVTELDDLPSSSSFTTYPVSSLWHWLGSNRCVVFPFFSPSFLLHPLDHCLYGVLLSVLLFDKVSLFFFSLHVVRNSVGRAVVVFSPLSHLPHLILGRYSYPVILAFSFFILLF